MAGVEAYPKVSIVIPTLHLKRPRNKSLKHVLYKRYTLDQVLHDLAENVGIPIEVIVVCNGQEPELQELVQTHPRIDKHILNSTNVGVARSWNMGAMMSEAEALCFLNDDVAVGPGTMETLYDTLISDPAIGEVGPTGSMWRGAEHDRYVGESAVEDADVISGFLFMMPTVLFSEIGGFDVNFTPAGFEEIDMSFSIRKRGYRCVVIPNLNVTHHSRHGASTSAAPIEYLGKSIAPHDLHIRNKAYFSKKWHIPA